jgi:hypothetical protein
MLFEQMRRCDVVHVEWRILPQQDHVEGRKISAFRLAEREMIAGLVAHAERLNAGEDFAFGQRELVGRIISERVAAALGFQQQRKRGIARDLDPLDRIHLDGDFQCQVLPPLLIFGVERRLDMTRKTLGRNQHRVET